MTNEEAFSASRRNVLRGGAVAGGLMLGASGLAHANASTGVGRASAGAIVPAEEVILTSYFLKIDGIKGESQDSTHQNQIELESYNVAATNSTKPTGTAKGKVSFGGLHVSKPVDASSPNLFVHCSTGKHIPSATLSMRASNASQDYLTITMTDVVISHYEQSAADNARPTEQFSLNFSKIKTSYT